LLTELARTGENSSIRDLWYIGEITYNQLKVVGARPPPATHHLGMYASNQQGQEKPSSAYNKPSVKCDWCEALHHDIDHCFSKDITNI
jgi:hypothetical protein